MNIVVNNKETFAEEGITVTELLMQLKYKGWVAVIINGDRLLERDYENTVLRERDTVKVIRVLSGG